MKELTIEEKAKAYDNTVNKLRRFMEHGIDPLITRADVQDFFPELAENEDERIRKELHIYLDWLDGRKDYAPRGEFAIRDMIAWLEKQEGCEHIKKDWLEHIKQSWYKEGFIDGKYSCGTSKEWTINDAATLKELIDFLENGTAKLQHDLTRYAKWLKIQFTPIEKQGKQKPKWTDADEAHLHSITTHLEQWIERHPNTCGADIQWENLAWLKSLKQRMEEQQ